MIRVSSRRASRVSSCLVFLDHVDGAQARSYDPEFMLALGELRGVFVVYVRLLADNTKSRSTVRWLPFSVTPTLQTTSTR